MKKKIMIVSIVAVLLVSVIALVACGGSTETKVKAVKAQIDALTEVSLDTADAAIIDSTMAGYLLSQDGGSFKGKLKAIDSIEGFEFTKEYYGVAAKKGKTGLIAFVNAGMKAAQADNTYANLLTKYGLTTRTKAITDTFTVPENWKSDLKNPGKVIIGFTNNAPMGICDNPEGNNPTGFDIELAKAVFAGSGITVETKLIEWDNKEALLQDINGIDLVWNGLTITPERQEAMEISTEYLMNAQSIVVKNNVNVKSINDLKGMKIVVESGSAGQDAAKAILAKLNK